MTRKCGRFTLNNPFPNAIAIADKHYFYLEVKIDGLLLEPSIRNSYDDQKGLVLDRDGKLIVIGVDNV